MNRITNKNLEALADILNKVTGSPTSYMSEVDGKRAINIGHFHISYAYGGVCLHRTVNSGGGVTTPLGGGHVTKRELWEKMHAFLRGLDFAKHGD